MSANRDALLFALTLMSAAASLVSIAGAQTLLALACLAWIIQRPRPMTLPSYILPLCAYMVTSVIAVVMSPEPTIGVGAVVRKFVLFTLGLLAASAVTTPWRARLSYTVLLAVGASTSVLAIIQFATAYRHFLSTGLLDDDPTVLARATGFMGHWMTFSGELLLVWCAALPVIVMLDRKWMIAFGIVGAAIVLSFSRSAWLGSVAGFVLVAATLPRKIVAGVALPVAIVAAAASGLIYHRVSMSFQQQKFAPDSDRMKLYVTGVLMIKDKPLFGVGPQRIPAEFPRYYRGTDLPRYYGHLENNILQIAAERGLLCLAAFLWLIIELYAGLIRMLKTAKESRWAPLAALSALTGFMVAGLFSYNFGDSEVLMLLLFIVSVPYGLERMTLAENRWPTELIAIPN